MAILSATLSCLLLISSLVACIYSQDSPGGCNLNLNRLVGRSSSYVYACNCPQPDGELGPVARAEAQIPSEPPQTAAQSAASIRCILNEEQRLLSICAENPRQYDREATKTLEQCLNAPTTAADRELKGEFTFKKDRCQAVFSTFFGGRTAAVWFCQCSQRRFDVVGGRSAFVTNGSPLGAVDEVEFVTLCTQDFLEPASRVCQLHPEDFELLTLHLLQVCCKRARVIFAKEKFQCAAIVPDDVSIFKVFT